MRVAELDAIKNLVHVTLMCVCGERENEKCAMYESVHVRDYVCVLFVCERECVCVVCMKTCKDIYIWWCKLKMAGFSQEKQLVAFPHMEVHLVTHLCWEGID